MPRRGKHGLSGMLRHLSLTGYILLFLSPPLGMLSLAAGHVLRRRFAGELGGSETDALIVSARAALDEMERELVRRIDAEFDLLAEELAQEIGAVYRRAVDRAVETLDRLAANEGDLAIREQTLRQIERSTLGSVQRAIARLEAEGA
jgi:hypothetical protein